MSNNLAAALDQGHRDALLAFYLGQYAANDAALSGLLTTPEDVYEYLLIDPLVTEQVPTSRVAQAMSSVQQYINAITLNMEPGYNTKVLDSAEVAQWKNGANQYGMWAGEVELSNYPENYIDPTLRAGKTTFFNDLETTLNQNQINSNNAQQAVLDYLNEFEQVANLEIVSGYLDGSEQTKGKYYFLGRSRTAPYTYYWRSLDMSLSDDSTVSAGAWSEWLEVVLPLSGDNIVSKVRPVIFNNRLYVVWFERNVTGKNGQTTTDLGDDTVTIAIKTAYLRFDGSWSTPQLMGETVSSGTLTDLFDEANIDSLCTLVAYDQPSGDDIDSLYAAIYINKSKTSGTYDFISYACRVDQWFNPITTESSYLSSYYATFDDKSGQMVIQSVTYGILSYAISAVNYGTPVDDANLLNSIPKISADDFTFDQDNLTINFDVNYTDTSIYLYKNNSYIAHSKQGSISTGTGNITISNMYISNSAITFDIAVKDDGYSSVSVGMRYFLVDGVQKTTEQRNDQLSKSGSEWKCNAYSMKENIQGGDFILDNYSVKLSIYINDHVYLTTATIPLTLNREPKSFYAISKNGWSTSGSNLITSLNGDYKGTPHSLSVKEPYVSNQTEYSFTYGVAITDINEKELKSSYYPVTIIVSIPSTIVTPIISSIKDSTLGTAEYLEFSADAGINNIRLNTLFTKELINKATVSIDALLAWDTQNTQEPGLPTVDAPDVATAAVPMDFNGANGLYFWELFFHMPYLVAWRLNQEQQFDDAASWLNYIFDPASRDNGDGSPDYWRVRPLVESANLGERLGDVALNPEDPDVLAYNDPVHYQKAIFCAYIQNLIDEADNFYRLLTNDGLSDAKLRYMQVKTLLGPRPDVQLVNQWQPQTLGELVSEPNAELRAFEAQTPVALMALPAAGGGVGDNIDNPNFVQPLNGQLLNYWNLIDSRLYNLRHYLSIDGQPINVPLYAPPVSPDQLLATSAQAGSLANGSSSASVSVPNFRFRTMLNIARGGVEMLTRFGDGLLSQYERGDNAGQMELQQQQAAALAAFNVTLQQQAIEALSADQTALQASQAIAQQRYDFYYGQWQNKLTSGEQQVLSEIDTAKNNMIASQALLISGGALNMAPNIFGFSDGGSIWGAAVQASGMSTMAASNSEMMSSQKIQISEGYGRRSDEWKIQYQQAQSEVDAITKQLDALAVRQQATQTALQQAQQAQTNLQTTYTFMQTRFSNSSLYQWLSGQLSALYYQAYDAVLSLCLGAEACWQYEMGDFSSRFIQTNAWNDSYRGLMVGETLMLNLQQLESAYINRYSRRLELTKTISLKQLLASAGSDFATQKATGAFTFSLTEDMFDDDYPGHYLRQLKWVSLSLPTLVGPYQDIRASLVQTNSSTVLKADPGAVLYVCGLDGGTTTNVSTNLRANQQVAVSTGLNDSGLFELSFGDERYLPFEGTGAVSGWQLTFPNYQSDAQQAVLNALNDVIIQVHYTALDGGASFANAVAVAKAAL